MPTLTWPNGSKTHCPHAYEWERTCDCVQPEAEPAPAYTFKLRAEAGMLWLRVQGPCEPKGAWKAYEPSEILDLLTEVECYDDGVYDRR